MLMKHFNITDQVIALYYEPLSFRKRQLTKSKPTDGQNVMSLTRTRFNNESLRTDLSQTTIGNLEALNDRFVPVWDSYVADIHDRTSGDRTQNYQFCANTWLLQTTEQESISAQI